MKGFTLLVVSLSAVLAAYTPADAGRAPYPPGHPDIDARLPEDASDRGGFVMRETTLAQRAMAEALAAEVPGLTLRWDGMSGAPRWIGAPPGEALTSPASGEPDRIARAFLSAHSSLFGLAPEEVEQLRVTSTVPAPDGGWHVHFTQTVGALEVLDGRVNVNLRPDGSIRSVGARLYAGLRPGPRPLLAPVDALRRALLSVYPQLPVPDWIVSFRKDGERLTVFDGTGFGFEPRVRLVLFPQAEGALLGWEVQVAEPTFYTSYHLVLDAVDGRLLYRENMTSYAEARYLDANAPEPLTEEYAPEQLVLATIPSLTSESPLGWISGDGTSLEGNNATSHLGHSDEPGLGDPTGIYDYRFNTPSSALVSAWWWVNEVHDRFYALGFNELAGNFQQDNLGQGGVGGDAIKVVVYTAGARNNAFFGPGGVDGALSTINLLWNDCRFCGDHDGLADDGGGMVSIERLTVGDRSNAFSREVITHEYSHGVVTRVLGGPGDASCRGGVQSGALGEGWSDSFAASFFDLPTIWDYLYEGSGCERDLRHDLTYEHLCMVGDYGCSSHDDGMIWAGTLWDLHESMQALDPAGGLEKLQRIVLEGIANTVCHPSLLDARQGILEADEELYGAAHHQVIWNVFANRGMGFGASTTGENDTDPVVDFTVPAVHECTAPAAPAGLAASPDGDNAIRLSFTASGAAAVEVWREDLDNPFDRASLLAYTDDTVTYLDDTVQGGKSYRYHVVALGGGGIGCRSDPSGTADGAATGSCDAFPVFDSGLTITDGDPDCDVILSWSAAADGCPGSGDPIVYSVYRAPTPGFEPSNRYLIGRTAGTTFRDGPPETVEDGFWLETGHTYYYLLLAQHGTEDDPPDHSRRGSDQLLRWVPGLPTLGRENVELWDFESGPTGWTADNTNDPEGGWVLVDPSPTYYAGALLAPDEAAGGSGSAWVTGDAGGPSSVTANDCDAETSLISPTWDGTGGATILSFDYWGGFPGGFWQWLDLWVDNGVDTVLLSPVSFRTVQPFETNGRHGWQRAELDLAAYIEPSSTMSIAFVGYCWYGLSEFGVDNVRIDRGTACSRSSLRLESVIVDDTPAGWGNGNGVIDPGETVRIVIDLANEGTATAFSPLGTISSDTPGVLIHENTAEFPDIAPAEAQANLGDGFTLSAPTGLSCSESLVFEIQVADAVGTVSDLTWSTEFGYAVTETILQDTFETDQGWISQGLPGTGKWERGDPVGTMNGSEQANPENDSPNDVGGSCWVTDNGLPGGDPNLTDVDSSFLEPTLRTPWLDLSPYKRARMSLDVWYYDDSTHDPSQDYGRFGGTNRQSWTTLGHGRIFHEDPTGGWVPMMLDVTHFNPMKNDVALTFSVWERAPDNVVEMGVDNVVIEGDRLFCDSPGVDHAPNGVGGSVRVSKVGGEVEIGWQESPVDASHDGAAYYEVFGSSAPSGGFSVDDTAALTRSRRALNGSTEFYKIAAVNGAGTSGDEPPP